jgi:hypothetical protein
VAYREWNDSSEQIVALLRAESGRIPSDRALRNLIEELLKGSSEFAALWEAHDVGTHLAGKKLFHHPDVGALDLSYEAMQLRLGSTRAPVHVPAQIGQRRTR